MSDTDDIIAIQQLLARHNTAVDGGDGQGYADTWTDDGSSVTPQRTTTGREALMVVGATAAAVVPGLRHWTTNHAIHLDGDHATATVYVLATAAGDPLRVIASGQYADQLRRTPAGWRFALRSFTPDQVVASQPTPSDRETTS